jgi:hypothetical protein
MNSTKQIATRGKLCECHVTYHCSFRFLVLELSFPYVPRKSNEPSDDHNPEMLCSALGTLPLISSVEPRFAAFDPLLNCLGISSHQMGVVGMNA